MLVAAWPVVVAVVAAAYVAMIVVMEGRSAPEGSVFMMQFTPTAPPLRDAWPAYVILFAPPVALVFAWAYAKGFTRRARS